MTPRRQLLHPRRLDEQSCLTSAEHSSPDLRATTSSASSKERCRPQRPVLYKSTALAATAPSLAFRRYDSTHIAAAAAEADEVRERFKAEQLEAAGVAEVEGESEEAACAKKYLRRLLLNRHSAAASRLRKEAYVSALEKQLAALEKEYLNLLGQYGAEKKKVLSKKIQDPRLAVALTSTSTAVGRTPHPSEPAEVDAKPTNSATMEPGDPHAMCDERDVAALAPLSELDMPPFFLLE